MKLNIKLRSAALRKSSGEKRFIKLALYKRSDVLFAVNLVKSTPVTPEIIESTKKRVERANAALSADFLEQYKTNSIAA
jgi:hypothetical protein